MYGYNSSRVKKKKSTKSRVLNYDTRFWIAAVYVVEQVSPPPSISITHHLNIGAYQPLLT